MFSKHDKNRKRSSNVGIVVDKVSKLTLPKINNDNLDQRSSHNTHNTNNNNKYIVANDNNQHYNNNTLPTTTNKYTKQSQNQTNANRAGYASSKSPSSKPSTSRVTNVGGTSYHRPQDLDPSGRPSPPPGQGHNSDRSTHAQGASEALPSGAGGEEAGGSTGKSVPSCRSSSGRPAYLLHRDLVIGRGSYGQVCIASREAPKDSKSGKRRKFASKCVQLKPEPKYIAKLQEEVCVLKELRGHPFIIQLHDVLCIDNELFIITELGRGGDLFHLLTTHPKHGVTESYAAKSLSQMLSAITYMHDHSIAHRDLKLENWVLMSPNAWSDLKLIDFGLSTHFERNKIMTRVVGSSYYVSPQVLKRGYTEACDLWSLGVIAYMLLSGAPPFFGASDSLIKQAIINGTYTFPSSLFKDVSEEAKGFVCSLLSYAPEYRLTARQALNHPWLLAAAPKAWSTSTETEESK